MNIILNTDSYKMSHFLGYPKDATEMYSYLESRGGKYDELIFAGLQPILKELEKGVTKEDVEEARVFAEKHGVPFNLEGWNHILEEHDGLLPVEIKAVPEGMRIPTSVPMLTICNTDPKCVWLTSYLETMLLRIWYPITVATRIAKMKDNLRPYYKETTDSEEVSPFAILDFSSRGVSSLEQSEIGGFAYLLSFMGSDNVPAVDFTNKTYGSDMSGFSVPATEHSIMCSFEEENELQSFEYLLDNMAQEGGILSVVSDTWDIFRATESWVLLRDKIIEKNVTLVVRPDSGEIEDVLPHVLKTLEEGFGYDTNSKGYKVLRNVKVLWGDGINEDTGYLPFEVAKQLGISADSIMTGSGGGLMQQNIDRDTAKFAIKGSNVIVNGKSIPISKSPVTDKGKRSKSGKFSVVPLEEGIDWVNHENDNHDLLEMVFRNGQILRYQSLENIRERLK